VRTAYEILSRPVAGTVFGLTLVLLLVSVMSLIEGFPLPRLLGGLLAAGAIWSFWTPVRGTIKVAKEQAASWRAGDTAVAGRTGDEYWIRTQRGEWRYASERLRLVRRLFGFAIVEVDGNRFFHIAIPNALWIDPKPGGYGR
jgi:hypothetical protein